LIENFITEIRILGFRMTLHHIDVIKFHIRSITLSYLHILIRKSLFTTSWPTGLRKGSFPRQIFQKAYDLELKAFVFIKKFKLRINSAASSRDQWMTSYFIYFPWPPLEVECKISRLCFLLTHVRKGLFLTYTLLMIRCPQKEREWYSTSSIQKYNL
jgi:hypothetical protein